MAFKINLNLKQADEKRDQTKTVGGKERRNVSFTTTFASRNETVSTTVNNLRVCSINNQHGKLSIKELKKLMSKERCFVYRKTGHNSKNYL